MLTFSLSWRKAKLSPLSETLPDLFCLPWLNLNLLIKIQKMPFGKLKKDNSWLHFPNLAKVGDLAKSNFEEKPEFT